jgi:hypothetical protein
MNVQALVIGEYTAVLRQGHLELYENSKGDWQERNTPDLLFLPDEKDALAAFLQPAGDASLEEDANNVR